MKEAIDAVKEWLLESLLASGPRSDLDMVLVSARDNPNEILNWAKSQMDAWVHAVDQGQGYKIEDKVSASQVILDAIKIRFTKELGELPPKKPLATRTCPLCGKSMIEMGKFFKCMGCGNSVYR